MMQKITLPNMFKQSVLICILGCSLVASGWSMAGSHSDRQCDGKQCKQCNYMHKRLKRLSEKLELSAEQKEQAHGILKNAKQQHKAIRQATKDQIKAILTPKQADVFESMHKKSKDKKASHSNPSE